jgi:hypothetical protein
MSEPRAPDHATGFTPQRGRLEGILLHERRQGGSKAPNDWIVSLTRQKDEVYLNLVLEFVPETVYRASRHYSKLKQVMPMLQVKLYMYQVSPASQLHAQD